MGGEKRKNLKKSERRKRRVGEGHHYGLSTKNMNRKSNRVMRLERG